MDESASEWHSSHESEQTVWNSTFSLGWLLSPLQGLCDFRKGCPREKSLRFSIPDSSLQQGQTSCRRLREAIQSAFPKNFTDSNEYNLENHVSERPVR